MTWLFQGRLCDPFQDTSSAVPFQHTSLFFIQRGQEWLDSWHIWRGSERLWQVKPCLALHYHVSESLLFIRPAERQAPARPGELVPDNGRHSSALHLYSFLVRTLTVAALLSAAASWPRGVLETRSSRSHARHSLGRPRGCRSTRTRMASCGGRRCAFQSAPLKGRGERQGILTSRSNGIAPCQKQSKRPSAACSRASAISDSFFCPRVSM